MRFSWLTQGGMLFDNGRIKVMVDPYLSDSLGKTCEAKKRRIPVKEEFLSILPDVILITHTHKDHLDTETLDRLLGGREDSATVLASEGAFAELKERYSGHNIVLLSPHSVWSEGGITFYAVRAEHSDRTAVGFILDDGDKTYYVSGDTLYNFDVIDDILDLVEDGVDFAFLPINGKGCNMNAKDAADFAYEIDAKCAVPVHYGLFDDIDPKDFDFEDAKIIEPFEVEEL